MSRTVAFSVRVVLVIAFSAMLVNSAPLPMEESAGSLLLRSPDPKVEAAASRDRVLFLREPSANVASANNRDHVLFLREAEASEGANRVDAVFLRRDN